MHSATSSLYESHFSLSIGERQHDIRQQIANTLDYVQEDSDKANEACEQQQPGSKTNTHMASINDILQKGDNYYAVLSLDRHCTSIQIKKAYRKLALQYHPDKNKAPGADEAFKLISKAFAVLSDAEQRAIYDSPLFQSYNNHGNDISPEDLYNAFFGQDGLGDPDFSSATFVGPGFTPHTYYSNRTKKERQQLPLYVQRWAILLQVMPLFLLFAYSLLSTLMQDTSLAAASITITATKTTESLEISPELLVRQNFRIPPMIEPTFDHPGEAAGAIPMPDGSNGGGGGGTAVAAVAAMSAFGDRRTPHPPPLRSMSMGSIRGHDPYANGSLASPNVMFNYQQRMSIDEEGATTQQRESPPTTIGPYGTQPMMYGAAAYTTSAIPSPSSPDTPLVSPARPSFQHQQYQRHYSFSSTQQPSLSRVDPRGYDMLSYTERQSDHRPSIHYQQQQGSMMMSEVGFYNGQQLQEQQNGEHESDHSRGANIGQLLNPVHPLNNATTASTCSNTTTTTTPSHHPPESPHPSHDQEQQQQLLQQQQQQQQPSTSYAGYHPTSLVSAVTTTSSSASSSSSTPSSSVISSHRYDNNGKHAVTASNTTDGRQQQQQINGEDQDSGGGGASGFSNGVGYYRDGMLTNTYNAMHYAPPPFQNGLVNPFSGHHDDDCNVDQDLTDPLMLK